MTFKNEAKSHKKRVLIVDDNQSIRNKVREFLEKETGIEIIGEAENGLLAVEWANLQCPDIILMDIKMPVMDGIEATKIIKAKFPEVIIIAFTAYGNEEYRKAMLNAGVDSFIVKKSLAIELMAVIQNLPGAHN